jgi:hypothetical protein
MLEKLGGAATIVIAIAGLALISVFDPPVFVQIVCALAGSVVCLVGVVFAFAEGSILEARREGKRASKAG